MNRDRGCGRIQRLRRINGMWKYKGDLMPMMEEIGWVMVDVISCAAPNLRKRPATATIPNMAGQ